MDFEPQFTITPLMQRQLIAIERTVGFLEHLRLRPEWIEELNRQARIRDALASVQIEGSSLTYQAAFEIARAAPDRFLHDEEREFYNYLCAFDEIEHLRGVRHYRPSIGDITNLHRVLVSGVRGGNRFAGQVRNEDVKVGDVVGGETVVHHQPPPYFQVEGELRALLSWINKAAEHKPREEILAGAPDEWIHPVIIAGIAQHRLVWIHPFLDGNGRTARMFTALLLYYRGYDFKYLFDLSSYYNEDRDLYYESLRTADRTGDYTRWIEYFMGGFARQMYQIREQAHAASEGLQAPVAGENNDQERD